MVKPLMDNTKLTVLRDKIIKHLTRNRLVWITGLVGKTVLAKALMESKQFRKFFIPLVDLDHVEVYRELLWKGGWAEVEKPFYFIDSYDNIRVELSQPALIVSKTVPLTLKPLPKVVVAPSKLSIEEYLREALSRVNEKYRRLVEEKHVSPKTLLGVKWVIKAPEITGV